MLAKKITLDRVSQAALLDQWRAETPRINAKEVIVDAGKPTITGMRAHAIENLTGKADRAAMTQEKAQSFVDTAKLTLYQQEKGTLRFVAVDGYAALNFTHELVTAVPEKIRRKYAKFVEEATE